MQRFSSGTANALRLQRMSMMSQNRLINQSVQFRQFSKQDKDDKDYEKHYEKVVDNKRSNIRKIQIAGAIAIGAYCFSEFQKIKNKHLPEEESVQKAVVEEAPVVQADPAVETDLKTLQEAQSLVESLIASAKVEPVVEAPVVEAAAADELIDVEITGAADLEDGTMMELKVGAGKQDKVLITRYRGKLYAIGAYCTHFGAPLVTGALFDDKVLCPWHAAGFSVTTGALELAPGRDGVPAYAVIEKDGKPFVRVPKKMEKRKVAPMVKRDPNNKTRMVIVGGGASGTTAAETLRQSNFTGEITVISEEGILPYDRTLLSKATAVGDPNKWLLRDQEFFNEYGIDFKLGSKVQSIDRENQSIVLQDNTQVKYDKLLIATGGGAKSASEAGIANADLKNVFTLRSANDQQAIKAAAKNAQNIVVIGSGFISSEITSHLAKQFKGKKNVSLVCGGNAPLERHFGYDVGQMFLNLHEKNGASVYTNKAAETLRLTNDASGNVKSVILESGYELPADFVVFSGGVNLNTQLASDSGLNMDKNGGVFVNPFMQSSDPNIFAAGDIASFPSYHFGENIRIEHWIVAQDQGTYAAFNMLGKMQPYGAVPFFWTNQYGKGMGYCGHAKSWDEIHIDGVPRDNKFIAYYIKNNQVIAACHQQRSGDFLTVFEALSQNVMPTADLIKSGQENTESIRRRLKLSKGGSCRRANCCQKKSNVQ